jgi:DNA-binding MarR family transcriptional regulator
MTLEKNDLLDELYQNHFKVKCIFQQKHIENNKTEISTHQSVILQLINESNLQKTECNLLTLAKKIDCTMSALTQTIDRMIEHDLVIRQNSSTDRRKISLSLTDKGKTKLQEYTAFRQSLVKEVFGSLTEAEIKFMSEIYSKVISHN